MKTIKRARSKEDGIVFYSNTMPGLVAEAFVDAKNEMYQKYLKKKAKQAKKLQKNDLSKAD